MARQDTRRERMHKEVDLLYKFYEGPNENEESFSRTITIFGSARLSSGSRACADAEEVARWAALAGFGIKTGGGGGVMRHANKVAFESGAVSIGMGIALPQEPEPEMNPFVESGVTFHYFSVRKVGLFMETSAMVFLPGGFGTLDELFEVLTLVQTGKMKPLPIILIGKRFWRPLVRFLHKTLLSAGTISEEDLGLFTIEDNPNTAILKIISRLDN